MSTINVYNLRSPSKIHSSTVFFPL
jgi:hypothetical protein